LIADLRSLDDNTLLETDVCIVGGGAAGITLALELQHSGLQVCLLESGGLTEAVEETQALYTGESVGHPIVPDFGRNRGLGGTTSRWNGRCAPLSPIDFAQRPWVRDSGWPINSDELLPYFRRAWSKCAVHNAVQSDQAVLADLKATRLAIDPSKLDHFIWRFPARTDLSQLHFGQAFASELRRSPAVRVLLHANICGFEASDQGQTIDAVIVKSLTGITARVRAQTFVLSCGGLENARILLNSVDSVPGGLGNAHGLVGRYFMQHLKGHTAEIHSSATNAAVLQDMLNFFSSRNGTQYEVGFSLPEQVQQEEQLLNASATLAYEADAQSSWNAGKVVVRSALARKVTRETGRSLGVIAKHPQELAVNIWRRNVLGRPVCLSGGAIRVFINIEQMPDPDSRVMLTDDVDVLGLRRMRVDWRVADVEGRTARRMTEAVGSELERLGLGTAELPSWMLGPDNPAHTLIETHHHIGTTRMAESPHKGVVDADCRVHGTTNLFVAGSSVFVTGGHANPTLTIVALAVRLADHLRDVVSSSVVETVRNQQAA